MNRLFVTSIASLLAIQPISALALSGIAKGCISTLSEAQTVVELERSRGIELEEGRSRTSCGETRQRYVLLVFRTRQHGDQVIVADAALHKRLESVGHFVLCGRRDIAYIPADEFRAFWKRARAGNIVFQRRWIQTAAVLLRDIS